MRFPYFLACGSWLIFTSCTNSGSDVATRFDGATCPAPSRTSPDPLWGLAIETNPARGESTATISTVFTSDSGLVVAGAFRETLKIGTTTLESAGGVDLFVVSFDPNGRLRFARRFGGPTDEVFGGIATGGRGGIYLAAGIKEAVDFGSGTLPIEPGSFEAAVIVRIDSAGVTNWGRSFSGANVQVPLAVAADAEDQAYLAGAFEGPGLNFGLGPLGIEGSNFIVALQRDGLTRYTKILEGNMDQRIVSMAPGPAGDIAVGGWMKRLVVDGVEVRSAAQEGGYVLRLEATGRLAWARATGSPELDGVSSVAFAPDGDALVGGFHEGPLSMGPGLNLSETGYFWARFEREMGTPKSLRRVPFVPRIGVDAAGHAYLAGQIDDAFDFGDVTLGTPGRSAIVLMKVDAAGEMRRATALRAADQVEVTGFSVDKCGRMAVSGAFVQAIDLGAGRVLAVPKSAGFVAVYPP